MKEKEQPTHPQPLPFYFQKSNLHFEKIEGGDQLPDRIVISKSAKLHCDNVLTIQGTGEVITGLRLCRNAPSHCYGDLRGKNSVRSFLWLQAGRDADTGKDAVIAWLYRDWMPVDGCGFIKMILAQVRRRKEKTKATNKEISKVND